MNWPHTITRIRDAAGVGVDDWNQPVTTTAETALRGFLQARNGREVRQANDAGTVGSTHVVYVPAGTDILTSDRVRFEDQTFQVRFVTTGRGLMGSAYRRADLFLVQQ